MKHLISISDLSRTQAVGILDTAAEMAATQSRSIRKLPTLMGKTVVNLFFEDSTRTRMSFEAAARRLSADVINFSAKGSSLSKGESLKDTARTLDAMGADAIVVRSRASGSAHLLAHAGWIDKPIVNAGDGTHQHPTQALLDAYTLRRHLTDHAPGTGLDGLHVVIVGDILHSRVARSNVQLLSLLGAHVRLVAPPALVPLGIEDWPCHVSFDFDEAITEAPDAVMMLRVQRERMVGGGFFPSAGEYSQRFQLTKDRADRLPEHAKVLHPGPMNRGFEIASDVADGPRSTIVEQVRNGVSTRMSVLYHVLAAQHADTSTPATETKDVS